MNILQRIRRRSGTLARFNIALFGLVWLSIVAAPCAMAMQAGLTAAEHDCPHCPPRPCHEVASDDCDAPDALESPRLADKTHAPDLLNLKSPLLAAEPSTRPTVVAPRSLPPARAGPRAHLVHVQFNE